MRKLMCFMLVITLIIGTVSGCSKEDENIVEGVKVQEVDKSEVTFPRKDVGNIKGLISYPVGTQSNPNKRTIFQRMEKNTNVKVDWTAISSDQWGEKIALNMANVDTLSDFVFSAGFSDADLLKYADQGVIINVEGYIEKYMPNLSQIFNKYPEYKAMCQDENGHIWAFPWIEQLGKEKEAIQTVGNMCFINQKWLDFLKLKTPTTVDEFENVLLAFKNNADKLKKQFNIDGEIIPMSCIVNDDTQDPSLIINGFGEGFGDNDKGRHIAVNDDKKVICTSTQEGYKKGIQWLNKLYKQGLIDSECFTQEWSTYVAKGKSGRYGVCFSWDVANIDNIKDFVPLAALSADTKNITPQNGSFTSGFDRGRCVVTTACKQPALVCAWIDQMYAPLQSIQNNWGTYGENDEFDIFELSKNANGEDMLKHKQLGSASPIEVREAECVGGPLAVLDEYYGKYVTCPDDAKYRLDWIKNYYVQDMHTKYVYPNVLMNAEDLEDLSDLSTDILKYINTNKATWIRDGVTDEKWEKYLTELDKYGLEDYIEIYQKYYDLYDKK